MIVPHIERIVANPRIVTTSIYQRIVHIPSGVYHVLREAESGQIDSKSPGRKFLQIDSGHVRTQLKKVARRYSPYIDQSASRVELADRQSLPRLRDRILVWIRRCI